MRTLHKTFWSPASCPWITLTEQFTGTLFLLAAVVGSGIMGARLAGGNVALALLVNTLATGTALVAIILAFLPISGAHLNPAVTLADAQVGDMVRVEGAVKGGVFVASTVNVREMPPEGTPVVPSAAAPAPAAQPK